MAEGFSLCRSSHFQEPIPNWLLFESPNDLADVSVV